MALSLRSIAFADGRSCELAKMYDRSIGVRILVFARAGVSQATNSTEDLESQWAKAAGEVRWKKLLQK
jgi:hypothetical protein